MAKCILLSRVSTVQQKLDSQTQSLVDEAKRHGFTDTDFIIIEEKESAIKLSEEERNGLNRMKDCIEHDNSITHVFIYELSRLSRRQLVLFSIRDYLIERGIQLVCCTPFFQMLEDGKLSQTANLMFSIFASMAESEMSLKQERLKRGRMRNKMTGKIDKGKVLFGYRALEDKTIVEDEEEGGMVREVFRLYSTGQWSIRDITNEMMQRHGTVNDINDRMFYRVARILKTTTYLGNKQYPKIVSEELFEKAREAAKGNKTNNKHFIKDTALLKRLIYSGGKHMFYKANSGRQIYTTTKPATTIQVKHIDQPVLDLAVMLHKAYIMDSSKVRREMQEKADRNLEKVLNTQVKIKKIMEKIDKVEERVIFGSLSEDRAKALVSQLLSEKKACEELTARLEEEGKHLKKMMDSTSEEELPDYASFSIEEKTALVRQMVHRIDIERTGKYTVEASIKTCIDNFLYTLHINTWTGEVSMSSRMLSKVE